MFRRKIRKVYCSECKFLIPLGTNAPFIEECSAGPIDTWFERKVAYRLACEKNKNNDCPDFEGKVSNP